MYQLVHDPDVGPEGRLYTFEEITMFFEGNDWTGEPRPSPADFVGWVEHMDAGADERVDTTVGYMVRIPTRPGANPIYLSHSAGRHDDPDWFVVEPRDDPRPQVESLLQADRRVLALNMTAPIPNGGWLRWNAHKGRIAEPGDCVACGDPVDPDSENCAFEGEGMRHKRCPVS